MKRVTMAVVLGLSGCISINTFERQMKKCRDAAAEADQLKAQVDALSAENSMLQKNIVKQSEEQEALEDKITDVRSTYDELVQELKDTIAQGDAGVKETADGLIITLGNEILFRSGSPDLQPKGMKVLGQVAGVISRVEGKLIQVEGHSDNVPISGSLKNRFPSNWELSAARSASVVRFLQEKGGVDPSLLVLTAFADNHPATGNATPQGRQQNRRVEIKLISR